MQTIIVNIHDNADALYKIVEKNCCDKFLTITFIITYVMSFLIDSKKRYPIHKFEYLIPLLF